MKTAKQVNITVCTDSQEQSKNKETDHFATNKETLLKLINIAKKENVNIEKAVKCEELKKFKQKLVSYVHLDDIDKIWKDVEAYASQVNELEKRSEGFAALIQENKEEVNEKISDALQATNTVIESFTKRIKYVYLIAGGSAGLAIIELILLFMKVI